MRKWPLSIRAEKRGGEGISAFQVFWHGNNGGRKRKLEPCRRKHRQQSTFLYGARLYWLELSIFLAIEKSAEPGATNTVWLSLWSLRAVSASFLRRCFRLPCWLLIELCTVSQANVHTRRTYSAEMLCGEIFWNSPGYCQRSAKKHYTLANLGVGDWVLWQSCVILIHFCV